GRALLGEPDRDLFAVRAERSRGWLPDISKLQRRGPVLSKGEEFLAGLHVPHPCDLVLSPKVAVGRSRTSLSKLSFPRLNPMVHLRRFSSEARVAPRIPRGRDRENAAAVRSEHGQQQATLMPAQNLEFHSPPHVPNACGLVP